MSDMNLARRATAQVAFDGVDITKSITPYLLSLTYTDSEDSEADDLQIKLQDRDGVWLESWLEKAIDASASNGTTPANSSTSSTQTAPQQTNWKPEVGNVVNFTGTKHYTNANAASGPTCTPGKAKVTQIYKLGQSKHPYHLIHVDSSSSVYGWVDEKDVQQISTGAASASSAGQQQSYPTYKVNAKSGLNVRSGPGTNYSRYGALSYGTTVAVTGSSGGWSIINYNGKTAYVYTEYLTPTGNTSASMPTLKFGDSGTNVKTMQQYLVNLGYSLPRYGVDGYFGSETQGAVKAFQKDKGLTQDGVCGPKTWDALLAAVNSTSSTPQAVEKTGMSIGAVIVLQNMKSDGKDAVLDCGQFELDQVDHSGPPSTVTIKATALPFTSTIRQTKKNKAWEYYNLSGIANEMASANGMSCMFLSRTDPYYRRVEQYNTSDMAFLQKLCKDSGLSLKASNNIIVLYDQSDYEAGSPILTIRKGDKSYEKWKLSSGKADTEYTSCRVRYSSGSGTIEGIARVEDYDADSLQFLLDFLPYIW